MRTAAIFTALILLAGCSGGASDRGGRLAKEQYLSAIQVIPAPMHTGSTSAPMVGLVISGTITNGGNAPLLCSRSAFVLVRAGGGDIAPVSQFCALPTIAPQQSTFFNATFATAPRDDLQLRFEHGDGSYEVHDLAVPPG